MSMPLAYSYIRMSTDVQLKGDSRRRQLESSEQYAREHGLELIRDSLLEDIGVSAFKGANIKEGALGRFLDAIKAGKIAAGSYLLVESLDRISRQEVRKSLAIFLNIIEAGITIVTLADGRVYTAEKTDEFDLISSLVTMSRAHEESRTKSLRIRAAWANKRATAAKQPLTAICPAWLRLVDGRKRYEIITERAEIVRAIFADTVAGIGNYTIARRLNENKISSFGRSNGWHKSYVAKIITNRSVLGEFQPHKIVDGRRVPDGEPIDDYFPSIVDEQLFNRAQYSRAQRRKGAAGRKGKFLSNIFSGLAKCAYCNAPMIFENKGSAPKGATFLVCDSAKRGMGCFSARWRYDHFEASFLAFVREVDLASLVHSEADVRRRTDLENEINGLRGQIAEVESRRDRTYELFTKVESAVDFVGQKLNELEQQRTNLEATIKKKELEQTAIASDLSGFYDSKDQIKKLLARLQKSDGGELYKLRSQIASKLKSLIEVLQVAPLGNAPLLRKTISFVENEDDNPELATYMTESLNDEREHRRYFVILFKDKTVRGVYPDPQDPLRFKEQVIGSPEIISRIDQSGAQIQIVPKSS